MIGRRVALLRVEGWPGMEPLESWAVVGFLRDLGGLAVVEAEDYMGGVEEGYDHDDAKEQVGAAGAGDGGLGEVGGS